MEYARVEKMRTPAIASNTATVESDVLIGFVDYIKIEVRTSADAASSNTCTVTITDNVLGRTLLTATGITGISNLYPLRVQTKDVTGTAISGNYALFSLASQRLTATVTSGTNTDYVIVYVVIM